MTSRRSRRGNGGKQTPRAVAPDRSSPPASKAAAQPPFGREEWAFVAILGLFSLISLLWIGDVPWISDEPALVWMALDANQAGHLASLGLTGSRGVAYGPLPIWCYQLLLTLTHNMLAVVCMRTIVFLAVTGLALVWLVRLLGRDSRARWFFVTVPLSPFFWFYARLPWDNSFAIPLAALLVAATVAFFRHRSAVALMTAVFCLGAMPLIHLMTLPLVIPAAALLAIAVFSEPLRKLARFWPSMLLMIAFAVAFAFYFRALSVSKAPGTGRPILVGLTNHDGFLFPLMGSVWLSAFEFCEYFATPAWTASQTAASTMACMVSMVVLPLAWFGMVCAAVRVCRDLARRPAWQGLGTPTLLSLLALLGLGCQVIENGLTATYGYPHYYNGTWIIYALFVWAGLDVLIRWTPMFRWWIPFQAAALAVFLASFSLRVHDLGGIRSVRYGLAIKSQIEVARAIDETHAAQLNTDIAALNHTPLAIATLQRLMPGAGPASARPTDHRVPSLAVRYEPNQPPFGMRIVITKE
ncbi:MAG: hypothetical protein ABFC63_05040 [Thermoguttaceae bacterium]